VSDARSEDRRESLRRTFTDAAELYDRARPGYPEAMVDDLVSLTGLGAGARVLEIGCGTGQLTVPLVRRGVALTGVELGAELAALARRNVMAARATGSADIVVSAFEEWSSNRGAFDLVVAATAFHWVDPAVRVNRSVQLLRPGGSLAVIGTAHVRGPDGIFDDLQDCYVRWDADVDAPSRLLGVDAVPLALPELDESPLLGPVRLRRYVWDLTYSADAYIDLLMTYSNHRALPALSRDGLLQCVRALIEGRGGPITKTYLTELRVAQRAG
jgi:SAM-dependent methyltransferase